MWERQSKQAQSLGWPGEGRGERENMSVKQGKSRHCKERQRQEEEEEKVVGKKGTMRRCKHNRR